MRQFRAHATVAILSLLSVITFAGPDQNAALELLMCFEEIKNNEITHLNKLAAHVKHNRTLLNMPKGLAILVLSEITDIPNQYGFQRYENAVGALLQQNFTISAIFKTKWNNQPLPKAILLRYLYEESLKGRLFNKDQVEKLENTYDAPEIDLKAWENSAQAMLFSLTSNLKKTLDPDLANAVIYTLLEPLLSPSENTHLSYSFSRVVRKWDKIGKDTILESILVDNPNYWPKTEIVAKGLKHLIQKHAIHLHQDLNASDALQRWLSMSTYFLDLNHQVPSELAHVLKLQIVALKQNNIINVALTELNKYPRLTTSLIEDMTPELLKPDTLFHTVLNVIELISKKKNITPMEWHLIFTFNSDIRNPDDPFYAGQIFEKIESLLLNKPMSFATLASISKHGHHQKHTELEQAWLMSLTKQPIWPKRIKQWVFDKQNKISQNSQDLTEHEKAHSKLVTDAWNSHSRLRWYRKYPIIFFSMCQMH